jgi:uncharacterized membrane protein (TIGR02234 family)
MRRRGTAFLLLLAGGGLALVASAQAWWRAEGDGVSTSFTGTATTGGLTQALGAVTLVGTLLILALRSRGRQVVAGLLAVVGAAAAVIGLLRRPPTADAVRTQVREVSLADQFAIGPTVWPWVYAGAGILVLLGAVLVLVAAPGWASSTDRFSRERPVGRVVSADADPAEVWKAFDAGQDPTLEQVNDPDVRSRVPGDTMGSVAQDSTVADGVAGDSAAEDPDPGNDQPDPAPRGTSLDEQRN